MKPPRPRRKRSKRDQQSATSPQIPLPFAAEEGMPVEPQAGSEQLREQKLRGLREAVRKREYRVSGEEIAAAMLSKWFS